MPPSLKSTNRPIPHRVFWSFDTEDDSKGTVKQISISDGERFFHFTDKQKAREFLFTLPPRTIIAATNLEYDLMNLFGDRLDMLDIRFKAGGAVIVSARLQGTSIRFYDTLNHSPMGVARMGDYLGLPKLKMNLASWDYVDRDTLISQRFCEELQRGYNKLGAGFYATLPGTAMDLYRRKYLPFVVTQPTPDKLDFMFSGYYGGRTEVFNLSPQSGRIFYIDVNSMYPGVMLNEYPNPNISAWSNFLTDEPFCMADVTVKTPQDVYFPILPHRAGKLLFPVGTFRGVWCGIELQAFQHSGGRIQKVHRVLTFASGCFPFRKYVNALYPIKQHATNDIDRYVAKLLLNSLYGKFGERVEVVELVPLSKVKSNETAIVYGNLAIVKRGESIPDHTNVVWSAFTTAYARIILARTMEAIRRASGIVLYCDTDSIIYKAKEPLHEEGKEIGQWSLEGCYSTAHFLGPKLYSLEGNGKRTVHAKGVPKTHAVRFFDEGTATYTRPYRLRSALRRGLSGTYWADFTKRRNAVFDKRRVLDNGDTAPLVLREE